jgi:uridine kinase
VLRITDEESGHFGHQLAIDYLDKPNRLVTVRIMSQVKTIIGIAGASGAGKSLFANQLYTRMREEFSQQDITILNEDCYYRRRDDISLEERATINYDHPDALEHDLLFEHLNDLRSGLSIEVPQYDYSQHNRSDVTVPLEPSTILILEGILILHRPKIRQLLDLKVFVDVPLDICLSRRLLRDTQERGRTVDSVLAQYHSTVRPMYYQFIEPSKNHADIIVPRGGENMNALNVIQNHLDRVLEDSSVVE